MELVNIARSLPKTVEAIGGNAPVMANRFVEEGLDVLMGAALTQRVRDALNQKIKSENLPTVNFDENKNVCIIY